MTIENPPKLHVIVGSLCGPRAFVSADEAAWDRDRLGRDSSEWVTKPQAYVREDVAETETTALRRERDALLARVTALRVDLWAMFNAGDGRARDALLADDDRVDDTAAGKGVG